MSIDISNLSAVELEELRGRIDKTIEKRRKEDLIAVRAEVIKIVTSRGFTLQEVINGQMQEQRFVRGHTYRHPDDPKQEWVCTGSRPQWVRNLIASGIALVEVASA